MAIDPVTTRTPAQDDPTIGRLFVEATRDIGFVVKKEIELAKSELKVSVRAGGLGAALMAVAAFLLLLAIIMLSISIAYFIHWNGDGLGLHWAFLIVFGLYVAIAAGLVFVGIKKFKKVGPPEKAIEQGREIPKALRGKS